MKKHTYTFTAYGESSNSVLFNLTEDQARLILSFIHITEDNRRREENIYAPHLDMRRTVTLYDTLIGEIKDSARIIEDLRSDLSKDFMDRSIKFEDDWFTDSIERWTVTRENLLLQYIRQGDTKVYEL